MARKTKLTEDLFPVIQECLELGMSYSATAGVIQVTPESFANWMNWGKNGEKDAINCRFYALVRESESNLMKSCLQKIKISADLGNIESVKWLLERRFCEFAKQNSLNVKAQTENVNVHVSPGLTHDEMEKIRADILAKLTPRNINPEIKQLNYSIKD
jgi:tRNA A37 N6-isopentenylltransferase MiaA